MSEAQASHLWQTYNEKLIGIYEQSKFPIINFDLAHAEYLKKIDLIRIELDLGADIDVEFFDKNLVNQNSYVREDCPENLLPLYDRLLEICI